MKISHVISRLEEIKTKFGDLPIVGGYLDDDGGLDHILVVNVEGMEIFPKDPNGVKDKGNIEGVFLT